jgi:dienelactone hydrolase
LIKKIKYFMDISLPFHKQKIVLANGIAGRVVQIDSSNVINYEGIVQDKLGDAVALHAQVFVPVAAKPCPTVIIVPGSGGVNPAMLVHAEKLTNAGIAACVLDPFTGRSVDNTIAVQEQFSFAASTYDVFACVKFLNTQTNVDPQRIGAMGYSRGGIAVIQAAMANLATPALGKLPHLRAVLAGWPWCGFQFANPSIGNTAMRLIAADHDNWASVVQTQAYANAISARSKKMSLRIVKDARHGFGYGVPEKQLPEAMSALLAPVVYFNDEGVLLNIWTKEAQPGLTDHAIVSELASYITRGVTVGSKEGQMADFMQDFTQFFTTELMGA